MTNINKKIAFLFTLFLLILTFTLSASAANDKVDIYFFRGEGCSHCAALEPFLNYLQTEVYKGKLNIHDYEIWYDAENAALAQKFLEAYGEEDNGVPMTFIGTTYLSGYNDGMQQDFRAAIDFELENGPISPQDIVDGKMTLGRLPASEVVNLYFFRGEGCSHCAEEEPFLQKLVNEVYKNRLIVHEYEIWYDAENAELAEKFAKAYGQESSGVPMTFIGTHFITGFNSGKEQEFIDYIEEELAAGPVDPKKIVEGELSIPQVLESREQKKNEPQRTVINVPLIGEVDLQNKSLLLTTVIIGLVDGVNPCSLWVLTMLLAMVIHTDSRKKTLIIGFVYLFITAAIYALFILGVFSLLSYVRYMKWIRIIVACITLVLGIINLKDYFFFKQGVSLTIDDSKKPGLYKKMRNVLKNTDNTWAMIGATIVLSAGVSLVEFSCTAAFPVIWSNILAAHGVSKVEFALHLLLYMLLYQLDELIIFLVVVITMKSKKMEEKHGQVLKLFSGCLMVVLSVIMIISPALMNSLSSTLIIFGAAFASTLLILFITSVILPKFGIYIGHMSQEKGKEKEVRSKE
ncbi:MAG: hypothetical protein IJI14_03695 [Anaerolineaceae bacterium]|nr:hypothetical protein [Anaerolineaceae bacterium]